MLVCENRCWISKAFQRSIRYVSDWRDQRKTMVVLGSGGVLAYSSLFHSFAGPGGILGKGILQTGLSCSKQAAKIAEENPSSIGRHHSYLYFAGKLLSRSSFSSACPFPSVVSFPDGCSDQRFKNKEYAQGIEK